MTDPYFWLIQKLADAEPRHGYHSPDQMALEPQDIPVVVEHEPEVLAEAFADWDSRRVLREILPALKSRDTMELGRIFERELKMLCEQQVYLPVSDECDRRDDIVTQEKLERVTANAASFSTYGPL